MIITVTLNPAVDQTVWVDRLVPGEVNRGKASQLDPAGKGINVSRMVHRLGFPTLAFGFVAGEIGRLVESALEAERVQGHFVRVPGQTRINVTIVDSAGAATSLYGPGPTVPAEALARLEETLDFWCQASRVLVLAGSLPPGVPEDTYARLIRAASAHGVRTILDADGSALRLGIAASPALIKPNRVEAERLLGRSLDDEDAVVRGAFELCRGGVGAVVVSLGSAGAVCVDGARVLRVHAPKVARRSTVGSGDSLVAGLAVAMARGEDLSSGLALGTAAGAATAMSAGTALGTLAEIEALRPGIAIEERPLPGA